MTTPFAKPEYMRGTSKFLIVCLGMAFACVSSCLLGAEAKPAAPEPAKTTKPDPKAGTVAVVPKSVFVSAGKDPFFPDSARMPKPAVGLGEGASAGPAPAVVAPVKRDPYSLMKITGLIWSRRPVVSVNTVTMSSGDQNVEIPLVYPESPTPKMVRVSCLEVRRNSAIVQVEGERLPRELKWIEEN